MDERFPANLSARVTDLATRQSIAATVANISASGICVISQSRFGVDSIVKLEVADSTLFGCVVHCTGDAPSFRLGIEVIRILLGGTDLANLLNAVLVESLPATPGLMAAKVPR